MVPSSEAETLTNGLGYQIEGYKLTIRGERNQDGSAGPILPEGQVGEVYFFFTNKQNKTKHF
jgi:hypothetical protein